MNKKNTKLKNIENCLDYINEKIEEYDNANSNDKLNDDYINLKEVIEKTKIKLSNLNNKFDNMENDVKKISYEMNIENFNINLEKLDSLAKKMADENLPIEEKMKLYTEQLSIMKWCQEYLNSRDINIINVE